MDASNYCIPEKYVFEYQMQNIVSVFTDCEDLAKIDNITDNEALYHKKCEVNYLSKFNKTISGTNTSDWHSIRDFHRTAHGDICYFIKTIVLTHGKCEICLKYVTIIMKI